MSSIPTLTSDELVRSPAWLPLEVAADGTVRLIRLDEAAYRAASFLDQRLLGRGYGEGACGPAVLDAAGARLARPAHYIFHIGHVGSTLVSRLIGAREPFFCLREPALLRAIGAPAAPQGALPSLRAVLALLGRTWRAEQRAVVKLSSFLNELAEPILAGEDRPAALFMYASPLAYLCGILAGPNSRVELGQLAAARLQRLRRRLAQSESGLAPRSEGETIAMSWLCEMTTLHQAARRFGARVLWVNFDAFLADPQRGVQAVLAALGAAGAAGEIEALVSGPLMRQYSKAPEYAYDAALRREVLLAAEQEHSLEIRRGMAWLQQRALQHPSLAAVLEHG